jgi:hypothetical protein
MRARPPAPRPALLLPFLLLPLLLLPGCRRPTVEVSESQRSACRGEAERAATPEEALRRNADCLAAALRDHDRPPPAPSAPPVVAPPAPAPIDRYRYCRVHQEHVRAAAARLTSAAKPWMVAQKQYAPGSEAYLDAQQAYDAAVAELERLLPPEIRNGMDLLPTAAEAYSRCDRQVLEGTSGP